MRVSKLSLVSGLILLVIFAYLFFSRDSTSELVKRLDSTNSEAVQKAEHILNQTKQDAIPALLDGICSKNDTIRGKSAVILSKVDEGFPFAELIHIIESDNHDLKEGAIHALSLYLNRIKLPEKIENLLSDEDIDTRAHALWAIGVMVHGDTIEKLSYYLENDPVQPVRGAAASSLGCTKDPRAIPFLVRAVKEQPWGVVFFALHAIVDIKGEEAFPFLAQTLLDTETKHYEYKAQTAIACMEKLPSLPRQSIWLFCEIALISPYDNLRCISADMLQKVLSHVSPLYSRREGEVEFDILSLEKIRKWYETNKDYIFHKRSREFKIDEQAKKSRTPIDPITRKSLTHEQLHKRRAEEVKLEKLVEKLKKKHKENKKSDNERK